MADNLLQCSSCNTLNKISSTVSASITCGNCGRALISIPRSSGGNGSRLLLLGIIIGAFGTMYFLPQTRSVDQVVSQDVPPVVAAVGKGHSGTESAMAVDDWSDLGEVVESSPKETVIPRPKTGPFKKNFNKNAKFEITVPAGADYLVKLITDKKLVAAQYYVRSAGKLQTYAPLGTYRLHYCFGKTWQSESELFGTEKTNCGHGEKPVSFKAGYESFVQLIAMQNGNFPTSTLSIEEFMSSK
jgi:hypothetical protein